ncbi:hypothetical protein K4F52_010152 [Lecanicillium sp. MT-2017a]|nr:hypothetical protein K4F52_010152 [Lecanicillium sp. MT-2017a]
MDAGRDTGIGINLPPPPSSPSPRLSELTMSILATAASASPTSTPTRAPGAAAPSSPHDPEDECRLLGSFALLVQAALGALALLALVYKRWRERPQRPLKIWFFDVSKQVFGSVLVHIANIFISMLTSGEFSITATTDAPATATAAGEDAKRSQPYTPNPCSFYLLNIAIDTTLGIPILIVLLRLITAVVALISLGKPLDSIQSGNYGTPPSAWWWLKQSVIYFCSLFGMKICVLVIFITMPWISKVGDWALSWTEDNEKLQIAFVMMIFPLIMNGLQYYIIDSFIKEKVTEDDVVVVTGDDDDDDDEEDGHHLGADATARQDHGRGKFTQIATDAYSAYDSDDEADVQEERKLPATVSRTRRIVEDEYDPNVDSDAPTVIGSSSSSQRRMVAYSKS